MALASFSMCIGCVLYKMLIGEARAARSINSEAVLYL